MYSPTGEPRTTMRSASRDYVAARCAASGRQADMQSRHAAPYPTLAEALFGAGVLATHQADYAHANELIAQSLGVARSLGIKEQTANSLVGLSIVAHYRGEYDRAVVLLEEALPLYKDLRHSRGGALV